MSNRPIEDITNVDAPTGSRRLTFNRRHFLVAGATTAAAVAGEFPNLASATATSEATFAHNTAPNRFVEVDGVRYAYRRFGKAGGAPPLLLLHHYVGTMDWWDPALTNGLAASREVILFDNRGVGLSSGLTPNTVNAMADDAHAFIHGLGLDTVDLLAFSIGGNIGQELALRFSPDVRRLILVGTGPRGGHGMADPKPNVVRALTDASADTRLALPYLLFPQTPNGKAAAAAFQARIAERTINLDREPSLQTHEAQSKAIAEFGASPGHAAFMKRLAALKQPTLVVNGNNDIMVDTINSYEMSQAIPRAQLIIYPHSGHGSLYQYAPLFVKHVNLFIDRDDF